MSSRAESSAHSAPSSAEEATTHFGFTQVPKGEKQGRVREVFDQVAARYDVMNDLMSGGMHRLWKQQFVAQLPLRAGMAHLDLAGGTGDIAFRYRARAQQAGLSVVTTLTDINHAMLRVGQARAVDSNRLGFGWVCGNAEALPYDDASFDVVTIAFGIRNVTDIPAALREAHRVLKPGGVFACLEFSNVEPAPLRAIYDAYSFNVIPRIGALVANDRAAYQYLVESIRKFPDRERFAAMLTEAGFARVSAQAMTGGVVAIHRGWRV